MRTTSSPTASTNEFLSEANCVNTSVMGDSWNKKENWVDEMRIVDAEAKEIRRSRERIG